MNDEQRQAAFDSIAVEIFRLAHQRKLPDDEDECAFEADMNLALLFRLIPDLCLHNLSALADFVCALHRLETQEPERAAQTGAISH
jgi:hypothetical protein